MNTQSTKNRVTNISIDKAIKDLFNEMFEFQSIMYLLINEINDDYLNQRIQYREQLMADFNRKLQFILVNTGHFGQ